jgi:hypothetical protein
MWNKMLRVSEWLVNLLSLALLIYISAVLMRPHARALAPGRIAIGQTVPISDVNWSKSPHTLVLALQTTCHYCSASAPFYKELLEKRDAGAWQAVAVLPQPVQKSTAYMQAEGYSVPDVRQMNLGLIGVAGTPTLLLVDQKGKLEKEWVGRLDPSGENDVAETLGVGKLFAQDRPEVLVAGMGSVSAGSSNNSRSVTPVPASQDQSSNQPAGTKTITLGHYPHDAPVRIVQILEGTTDVTPTGRNPVSGVPYKPWTGKPFQAGNDWLKDVVIVVRNLSNKEVIAANIDLTFPQTGAGIPGDAVSGYLVMAGREPEHALYDPRSGRKHTPSPSEPLHLLPNQEVRIALAPYYDAIKTSVEVKQPISTITICHIESGTFYFADGTRWEGGIFEKPDPSTPGVYLRITPDEFNGTTPLN